MKRYIKSANWGGYNYRYEVHYTASNGEDVLFGATNDFDSVVSYVRKCIKSILDWFAETPKAKARALDSIYVYDAEEDDDDSMPMSALKYIDDAINKVNKSMDK